MLRSSSRSASLALVLTLLAGCTKSGDRTLSASIGSQGGTLPAAPQPPPGAPFTPTPPSGAIFPNGETFNGASLSVPPQAIEGVVAFTLSAGTPVPGGDELTAIGPSIRIEDGGYVLKQPATVTLPLEPLLMFEGITAENIVVLKRNETTGAVTTLKPTSVDLASNLVTVDVTSFSSFQPATTRPSRFAYVGNYDDDTIAIYSVDNASGRLRFRGYVASGNGPIPVAWTVRIGTPAVYAANYLSNDMWGWIQNPTTGTLGNLGGTQGVPWVTAPTGSGPSSIALHSSNTWNYVVNNNSKDITSIAISLGGGTTTGTQTLAQAPQDLSTDGTRDFVFATSFGLGQILSYPINTGTGLLQGPPTAFAATGTGPAGIYVESGQQFALVTNYGSHNVSLYEITAPGTLTPRGGPVSVPGMVRPIGVTVEKNRRWAFTANYGSNDVSTFELDTAAKTLTARSKVAAGTAPKFVTTDHTGRFAYAVNQQSHDITAYSIDVATGALTPIDTYRTHGTPTMMALSAPSTTAVTYVPRFLYTVQGAAPDIRIQQIDSATGLLSNPGSGSSVTIGSGVQRALAIDPQSRFLYVVGSLGAVRAYAINISTGALTARGTFATGASPIRATVDASGRYLHVLHDASPGEASVRTYAITQTGGSAGALTPVAPTPAIALGGAPAALAMDSTGRFLFAVDRTAMTLSSFRMSLTNGTFGPVLGTAATGSLPASVAADATGKFAYVANGAPTNAISRYTVGAASGQATLAGNTATGGTPNDVVCEPTGRFCYATNGSGGNTVASFTIDPTTGNLTSLGANVGVGSGVAGLAADPSGNFLYTANTTTNNVTILRIDQTVAAPPPGTLTVAGTRGGFATPVDLVVAGEIQ